VGRKLYKDKDAFESDLWAFEWLRHNSDSMNGLGLFLSPHNVKPKPLSSNEKQKGWVAGYIVELSAGRTMKDLMQDARIAVNVRARIFRRYRERLTNFEYLLTSQSAEFLRYPSAHLEDAELNWLWARLRLKDDLGGDFGGDNEKIAEFQISPGNVIVDPQTLDMTLLSP
jgi:hypothetical protein